MKFIAASAILAAVAAQPPLPPPGVSSACNATLNRMYKTMLQSWEQWEAHTARPNCVKLCIPNGGRITPTPGKICRAQCCDPDSSWEKDYIQTCNEQQGKATFKDIDLVWGKNYVCKGILGKVTPCIMSTSEIACMPTDCTAADIALVGAAETNSFCPSMATYNLTSCGVSFNAPPTSAPAQ